MQAADILIDEKTSAEVCPLLADTLIDREVERVDEAEAAERQNPAGLAGANNPDEINIVRPCPPSTDLAVTFLQPGTHMNTNFVSASMYRSLVSGNLFFSEAE